METKAVSVAIKRVLTIVLIAAMIVCECPAMTGTVKAANLPTVNEAQVTARLLELAQKLGLKNLDDTSGVKNYFTTHQGASGKSSGPENSIVEIITKTWFKKKFGDLPNADILPSHYANDGTKLQKGYQCAGFANFVSWYIAKENDSSDVYNSSTPLGNKKGQAFSYQNLCSIGIRTGDVIRWNYNNGTRESKHSMVFLKFLGTSQIRVLDCNWDQKCGVQIHDISFEKTYPGGIVTVSRVSNYAPDSGSSGITPSTPTVTLPAAMTSLTSAQAKSNIIAYAKNLVGYNRTSFTNAGRSDIPSGDWCTWFLKLCGEKVGVNALFSSKAVPAEFCSDMIQNYGAKGYYYTDSSWLKDADRAALNGAQAVTKSTFTPQPGDIYILHESGFNGISQVGFVAEVVNGSVYAVVGNNGTAQEVQYRASTTNTFYQINHSGCPIIGYIRPNYASLDAPVHSHSGSLVAAKAATCTATGNQAYYVCSCGKWFWNAACTSEITNKASVTIAAVGHRYTGRAITPKVKVEVKAGKNYVEVPADQYRVTYINNVNKGTAKAVVTGAGGSYGGSRTVNFKIAARNVKNIQDLWKMIFG